MKKISLLLILLALLSVEIKAQKLRANVYAMYAFDDKFESYYSDYVYYYGKIKGGLRAGVGLEFMLRPNKGIELMYLWQKTTAPTTYRPEGRFADQFADLDLNINYIMLGGNSYVRNATGKLEGFGGLSLGCGIVNADNPETNESASATKFAWGFRLGGNIWLNDRIGIKLQGDLLSLVQGAGGGLYFGTGGAGAGISGYSTMYQFGLGGGITFKIGAATPKAAPASAPPSQVPMQEPVK
jgi:hypothetical protein